MVGQHSMKLYFSVFKLDFPQNFFICKICTDLVLCISHLVSTLLIYVLGTENHPFHEPGIIYDIFFHFAILYKWTTEEYTSINLLKDTSFNSLKSGWLDALV